MSEADPAHTEASACGSVTGYVLSLGRLACPCSLTLTSQLSCSVLIRSYGGSKVPLSRSGERADLRRQPSPSILITVALNRACMAHRGSVKAEPMHKPRSARREVFRKGHAVGDILCACRCSLRAHAPAGACSVGGLEVSLQGRNPPRDRHLHVSLSNLALRVSVLHLLAQIRVSTD